MRAGRRPGPNVPDARATSPGARVPGVDVIIVTYRSASTVGPAVASVKRHEAVDRIVVVDNLPGDGSAAAAREAGADIILQSPGNVGFAAGVNSGLDSCSAPYVLLLNPDACLAEGSLELMLSLLHRDPRVVMVAPVLEGTGGTRCLGGRRFSTVWHRLTPYFPLVSSRRWGIEYPQAEAMMESGDVLTVDYAWGAALLCRRAFLDAVGGLDERFFMYSEDEDLGRQARRLDSLVLIATAARATHLGAASTLGRTPEVEARLAYAAGLLFEKWQGNTAAFVHSLGVCLGLASAWVSATLHRDRPRRRHAAASLVAYARLMRPATNGGDEVVLRTSRRRRDRA